jgi:hypothetical protein
MADGTTFGWQVIPRAGACRRTRLTLQFPVANLPLTPLASGLIMEAIGSWRRRRERNVLRLDTFAYGFSFALAMAVVRYAFGN